MALLTRLPAELFHLIAAYSTREDLKALRLTDRATSNVATPKLFEEIHISPNSSSFDRANSVAARKHLNRHVRSLVYHFGMLAEVYAGFDSFKHEYFASRNGPQSAYDQYELNAELLWHYSCWLEEIDAQTTFGLRDEAEELRNLCSGLPRLEAVSTILDEVNIFGDQEDYIGKRTGMAPADDEGCMRFTKLFAAAVEKPLRKVSARSIEWRDLGFILEGSDSDIRATQTCLTQLKYLELGLYRGLYDQDENNEDKSFHYIALLSPILGHAAQLETLKLDFDELPYEYGLEDALPISKAIFSHYWPRLRRLKLEALAVYEDEFCNFLFRHQTTLTTLCIGDIELATQENEVPSILNLFVRLHEFLRLESCRITGNFTNRVDQSWYVNTEHKEASCLREQIEHFICGESAENVNLAMSNTEEKGSWHSGVRLESYLRRRGGEDATFADESWQWAPELLGSTKASPIVSPVD